MDMFVLSDSENVTQGSSRIYLHPGVIKMWNCDRMLFREAKYTAILV